MIKPGDKVRVVKDHHDYGIEGRVTFDKPYGWSGPQYRVLVTSDKSRLKESAANLGRTSFVGFCLSYYQENLEVIDESQSW